MGIDIYSHNTYFAIAYCPATSFYLHFLYLVLVVQFFYNVLRPSEFDHFYTLHVRFECIFNVIIWVPSTPRYLVSLRILLVV